MFMQLMFNCVTEPSAKEKEKIELKEDLMWDYRVLDKISSSQCKLLAV